jgi:3-methyladenine DNA glycosylase AlkD
MSNAHAQLISALRSELAACADPERAQGQSQYMKRALPFLGATMPQVRKLTGRLARSAPLDSFARWSATVRQLFFEARYQEERYAAAALCGLPRYRAYQRAAALPLYQRMITTAAWWDIVDDVSVRVGEALLAEPEEVGDKLRKWARGKDLWLRRTSIICQRKHKEQTDWALLTDCMAPSLTSDEFFLHKAIGWALRAVTYHDAASVRRYVRAHDAELSSLSKREALKHLGPVRSRSART